MTFWGNIVYLHPRSVICGPSLHYKGANKQYSRKKSCYSLISTISVREHSSVTKIKFDVWESWSTPLSLLDFSFALSVSLRFYIMLGMIDLIHETRHLCTLPCGLIGTKNVQNLKHVTGSKSISQNPKQVPKSQTLPRVQVFLDSGTCFVPTSHRSTCLRINGIKAKSVLSIWGLAFQGARWWTQPTSRGVTVFFDVRVTHDNSKCDQGKATSTLFMEQEEEKKRK